jgi:putative transposase
LKRNTNRKRRPQPNATLGSKLLGGVYLSDIGSTSHPKKKSRFSSPPCQVLENEELTTVVRQFIEANRAVNEVEKHF